MQPECAYRVGAGEAVLVFFLQAEDDANAEGVQRRPLNIAKLAANEEQWVDW
jgi:hypothetical protein